MSPTEKFSNIALLFLFVQMAGVSAQMKFSYEANGLGLGKVYVDHILHFNVTSSDSAVDIACSPQNGFVSLEKGYQLGSVVIYAARGKRLGYEYVLCRDASLELDIELPITILKEDTWLDKVFPYFAALVAMCLNVIFGTEVSIRDIRFILMRPKPLIAAAICQFVLLPPFGLGVATLLGYEADIALGILMVSCAPGGGISNTASYLVGGEVPLSISMSFFSTAAAIGTMPFNLWLYSRLIPSTDPNFSPGNIPYTTLILTLLVIAVPVGVGMLLISKVEKVTRTAMKFAKPIVLLMVLVYIVAAIYRSLYAFEIMKVSDYLGGSLLPLGGFLLGAVASTILRLRCSQVKTVALEVGMQNSAVVVTMILVVFEQPQGNLNCIMPICISLMTSLVSIPLFVLHYATSRYNKRYRDICDANKEEQLRERQKFEGLIGSVRRTLSTRMSTKRPSAKPSLDDLPQEQEKIELEAGKTLEVVNED